MWFWYALTSALTSGVSVILNKKALKNISVSLVSWALVACSLPILIVPAFINGFPVSNNFLFFIGTVCSATLYTIAKTIGLKSIKDGAVSDVFPLISFGVLFSYVFALIFLNEKLHAISLLGLFTIILGSYVLKVAELKEGILQPFKSLLTHRQSMLLMLSTVLMSLTSVFDKMAMKSMSSSNAYLILFIENAITTILLTGFIFHRKMNWKKEISHNLSPLLVNGIVYTFLSLLWLWGITDGAIALVSGVKKLEILFVLIFGYIFLHDKPKKEIWVGSIVMLLGVILVKLG